MKRILLGMLLMASLCFGADVYTKVLFVSTFQLANIIDKSADIIDSEIKNFISKNRVKKINSIDLEKVGDCYYFVVIVYEK